MDRNKCNLKDVDKKFANSREKLPSSEQQTKSQVKTVKGLGGEGARGRTYLYALLGFCDDNKRV